MCTCKGKLRHMLGVQVLYHVLETSVGRFIHDFTGIIVTSITILHMYLSLSHLLSLAIPHDRD